MAPRRYSLAKKARLFKLVREDGLPVVTAAAQCGVRLCTAYKWLSDDKRQAPVNERQTRRATRLARYLTERG